MYVYLYIKKKLHLRPSLGLYCILLLNVMLCYENRTKRVRINASQHHHITTTTSQPSFVT